MQATSLFVHNVNILLVTNGTILGLNQFIVFILLVIIYTKLLAYLKQVRKEFGKLHNSYWIGHVNLLV